MTSLAQRQAILALIDEAVQAGARQAKATAILGLSARTLQRWRGSQGDRRSVRVQQPRNRLSDVERQRILSVVNSREFGHLPPSQIVLRPRCIGS